MAREGHLSLGETGLGEVNEGGVSRSIALAQACVTGDVTPEVPVRLAHGMLLTQISFLLRA